MVKITESLTLPSGLVLKNRLLKSSTTEGLGDEFHWVTPELVQLYKTWSEKSDVGIILSGNIQVDRRFLERPENVCIDIDFGEQDEEQLKRLREFASAGKLNNTKFLAQISHGGRQSHGFVAKKALAPSAIPSTSAGVAKQVVEMTMSDIKRVKEKFVYAARICENVGFDGVELHGAHGYLLSSFLSPRANKRNDDFGGSLENRARLMIEIVKEIKAVTRKGFTVGVKLNSSDFQSGGFTGEEAEAVAKFLSDEGLDFLELSGGNYESPAQVTGQVQESTRKREAYFLEFAEKIVKTLRSYGSNMPVCVTGGFRSKSVMDAALESGSCDMIGIARPMCVDPESPARLLRGEIEALPQCESAWTFPWYMGWNFLTRYKKYYALKNSAVQYVLYQNLIDLGKGHDNKLNDMRYCCL